MPLKSSQLTGRLTLGGGVTFASFHEGGHCCIDKDKLQTSSTGGVKYQHTLSTQNDISLEVQWKSFMVMLDTALKT